MLRALAASALCAGAASAFPAPADILASLTSANSYWMAQPENAPKPSTSDCGWTRGAYYAGHMEHVAVTPSASEKAALRDWALTWASAHNWTCGGLWQDPNNLACGMAFVALYDEAPEDYKLALAVTMDKSVRQWVGCYDWWWVDTLFMGLPSMLLMANRTGDARFEAMALQQYHCTSSGGPNATSQPGLWDPASNLYWRDHTYIAQRNSDGSKVFWGRGNGWASAALALAHRALPPSAAAERSELATRLSAMAQALRPLQQADGMWRANLLFPTMPGVSNPETTSSSFFTFALTYGINAGILDAATYLPVVTRAWAALSTLALHPSGLVGWCQPVGGGPAPATNVSTSDFCVGAFLMAGSQVYLAASGGM